MGSSTTSEVSAEFLAAFREIADETGFVSFERFMELALYHPVLGYYRRANDRVGRRHGTDFYTSTSMGPVFGELVIAAIAQIAGNIPLSDYTFVELGSESGASVLDACPNHPFAAVRTVGVDDTPELTGRLIVFSNELFDAQPCARLVRTKAGWDELGVVAASGQLHEVRRPAGHEQLSSLPASPPPGYRLDAPFRATTLLRQLARQPWQGLFLAFDYGKTEHELLHECPIGTVRAYHQHRQITDLLARPGEQDLTCHTCWDWLANELRDHRFVVNAVESQEAFFTHHSASALARIMQEEASRMSARKSGLLQLLHPAALGQKFQALSAVRELS